MIHAVAANYRSLFVQRDCAVTGRTLVKEARFSLEGIRRAHRSGYSAAFMTTTRMQLYEVHQWDLCVVTPSGIAVRRQ